MTDHGTASRYCRGCRCLKCGRAASLHNNKQARMDRVAAAMRAKNAWVIKLRETLRARKDTVA